MNRLPILAAVIAITLSALPGAVADDFWRKGLVEDEIKRHVIKECDLYTHYRKNMFEFPPLEVDAILYEIRKQRYKEQAALVRQIYSVVGDNPSFYRRSLTYDIYYGACIGRISVTDAENWIDYILSQPIEENIQSLDREIREKFTSEDNSDRAIRDKNRIRVLNFINLQETQDYIIKKNRSVIQEYTYDIELWEW
ncbi:MAG: hypothetical protein OXI57_12760 [Rhodospirillales bacterium]|nr:hypothetical protein [Rhodospirillales bacterium]